MAKRRKDQIPKAQLPMREAARRKFAREALPGLQPDEVARRSDMRRMKKAVHTIYRTCGSPAKHVKRLHPRRGE